MSLAPLPTLGIDVGGANLKAATSTGQCRASYFPMWKQPEKLADAIAELIAPLGVCQQVAVTMTGELADCFADRGEGVRHIVDHCLKACGDQTRFYSVDGRFVDAATAIADDLAVAASNWHAMASLAAQAWPGEGLVLDIGSTTTDLIPFREGRVATPSRTDFDRLVRGELIYVGVGRTPLCAIVDTLPYDQTFVPVMNELFAVTDDCAILTGIAQEDPGDCDTCDGRPRTRPHATARIARMVGMDHRQLSVDQATIMALHVWERLQVQWRVAAELLSTPSATWVLAGHGQSLVPVPHDRRCVDLAHAWNGQLSRVGPAYAVALLAQLAAGIPLPDPIVS